MDQLTLLAKVGSGLPGGQYHCATENRMNILHSSISHLALIWEGKPQTTLPSPSQDQQGAWLDTKGRGAQQLHSQLVQHPLHFLIDTHGRGLILLLLIRLPGGIAL